MHLLVDRLTAQSHAAPRTPEPAEWMTPADLLALLAPQDAAVSSRDSDPRTADATGRPYPPITRTVGAEE